MIGRREIKNQVDIQLKKFASNLSEYTTYGEDGQWNIKGFIDIYKNVFTISSDTKIVSKILEIHLFPKVLQFAEENNYNLILADHQNYYPDVSLVHKENSAIKFALDFKTTYRLQEYDGFCNGFTLGSHGAYFINRNESKNIQFPYNNYLGHFCLCAIYSRIGANQIDETRTHDISDLVSITSVINDIKFVAVEKWKIASDGSGSGNTANIGSIESIDDIINENGMFAKLGEEIFDDYWQNYNTIIVRDDKGKENKIRDLRSFLIYKGKDPDLIVRKRTRRKSKTP